MVSHIQLCPHRNTHYNALPLGSVRYISYITMNFKPHLRHLTSADIFQRTPEKLTGVIVTCFEAWATRLATFDAVIVHSVASWDMSLTRLLGRLHAILRSSAACVALEMVPFCREERDRANDSVH